MGKIPMTNTKHMSETNTSTTKDKRKRIAIVVNDPRDHEEMCMTALRDHFGSRQEISRHLSPYILDHVVLPYLGFRDRINKAHGMSFVRLCDVLDYVSSPGILEGLMVYTEQMEANRNKEKDQQ